MSDKNSGASPRSQDRSKFYTDSPRRHSSERRRFDDDICPVSPRESPTPSNSSHRSNRYHSSRHSDDYNNRERDRHKDSTSKSSSRKRREDTRDGDSDVGSDRKRRRADYKDNGEEKRSRKDRDKPRAKDSKREHRRQRSHEKQERSETRDRKSHKRKSGREKEQYDEEKSVEYRRSDSIQSSVVQSSASEIKSSPQPPSKTSLNPFMVTLLKPLLKEETSDVELEELLPIEILSGEMAKRSMPLPRSGDQSKRAATLQNHSQLSSQSQNQPQESRKEAINEQQSNASESSEGPDGKPSADENESRFDKFLSNLSDKLQEKEKEVETFSEANEVDFSDILIAEENTIRMAASKAALKPKQLLEACLSTPWSSLEIHAEEENNEKTEEKMEEDKEEEDPFDLVSLLSSNISRRYLDEELVKELEQRGISLTSTTGKGAPCADNFKSRMVPGVYEEKAFRRSLLGVIEI